MVFLIDIQQGYTGDIMKSRIKATTNSDASAYQKGEIGQLTFFFWANLNPQRTDNWLVDWNIFLFSIIYGMG